MTARPTGRRRGPIDRHWPYPNPVARVRRLLGRTKAGRDLCRRMADGDPGRVLDWMRRHEGPFEVFHLLQLGLGGTLPDEHRPLLFDEVPVAILAYPDRPPARHTVYARRAGPTVGYRVRTERSGAWVYEFRTSGSVTPAALRRLFRAPPWLGRRAQVEAELTFLDPGPVSWDPAAWPVRFGGWDGIVAIGSDMPVPCPACGSDINHLDADLCRHMISTWMMRDGGGHWAGRFETLEELRGAYGELEEAAGGMSKSRQVRFLRQALPAHLWRAISGYFRALRRVSWDGGRRRSWGLEDWGLDGLQHYVDELIQASPTSLGGGSMEKTGIMGGETWTVWWDTRAATRARELDRRFAADAKAFRRAAKAAARLAG